MSAEPGRNAEVYMFAHHPVDDDSADHWDPLQGRFYVMSACVLPPTNTISLTIVRKLANAVIIQEAGQLIEAIANATTETTNAR